jgi:hypothetical protein
MRGGVILFRGTGADAMRYVEADRSRADDYYLGDAVGITYTTLDASGEAIAHRTVGNGEYAGWVDWINPDTGEQMGKPRLAWADRLGSPRFAEMVINTPKSLSIAAALNPEVSEALNTAQQDALAEIQRWLGQHSVTRVGPRGKQEVVPVERLQVVGITHRTSRAGDPHRHIHMQVGTRVWAAGAWRALDTAAIFKQQGAIRALGTAVIAASPELAAVLDEHGLTLDPKTSEVAELAQFNDLMSKRGAQVRKNLERLEADWEASHPGESMGPVVSSRLTAKAWAFERPAKKPITMREEAAWLTELREAGYDPDTLTRQPVRVPAHSDELLVQDIASRALDRCAAAASAWTRHDVQEHATRIITEHGLRATPEEVRELVQVSTVLALEDCLSILPTGAPAPEHVAHLTSWRVVQVETRLRDLLTTLTPARESHPLDVRQVAARLGQQLDAGQLRAAAAVASTDPLVIVEGAAGAGKTTMLATAIAAAKERGSTVRVLAPTKRAAEVAREELDVPAISVAALVHAYGYRWNDDGVWTRLSLGQVDPKSGVTYVGPPLGALRHGDRIVVDEAGMLDQDAALALFTVAKEAGATVALVGDRAQLAAVGRGGVLDMAAQIRGRTFDMAEVHRFMNPDYAELTTRMRGRGDPGAVFDQLYRLGRIRLHADGDELREHLAQQARDGETITVASNDDAARLNERTRAERIARGLVDDTTTTAGSDGLSIGAGDLIQTRRNDTTLGVANRQQWIVQHVEKDGSAWVRDGHDARKCARTRHLPAEYVREHAHLSYAATAYGVQGVTTPTSHTILGEGIGGAAVYVGMTRGRTKNSLHVVAQTTAEARALFIDAMERDPADRGLADATERATEAVRGLVDDGPVKLVNAERARLRTRISQAEARASQWKDALASYSKQSALHRDEQDAQAQRVAVADQSVAEVRAQVAEPLIERATVEGAAYLAARARIFDANRTKATAGRWHRRSATRTAAEANTVMNESAAKVRKHWMQLPQSVDSLREWAKAVAEKDADADPRVAEATRHADQMHSQQTQLTRRHLQERDASRGSLFAGRMPSTLRRNARRLREQINNDRADLAQIEALPIAEAAQFVIERAEQITRDRVGAEQTKAALAARARRRDRAPAHLRGSGHDLGVGRSL